MLLFLFGDMGDELVNFRAFFSNLEHVLFLTPKRDLY